MIASDRSRAVLRVSCDCLHIVAFLLPHPLGLGGGRVIESDNMQHSVDNIEEQLLTRRPAIFLSDSFRGLPANNHFPLEGMLIVAEVEADHIGGVIVVEVLAIDILNRAIVDDGDGKLGSLPSVVLGDGFDGEKNLFPE